MDPDDAMELAEQMRDLGVEEFTLGDLHVKFRSGVVVPAEATRGGKSPGEHTPPGRSLRDTATAQGIGPPSFPGSAK